MHYCFGASCYQALVCPAVKFFLSSAAALSWKKSVGELTYLVVPMASFFTPNAIVTWATEWAVFFPVSLH